MALFRTSARSVDMLGRQQIAGIPTAISEIFKNAYDAYATGVRGDFFPDRGVLMIRDDGIGMSLEDFMKRWLTVGTDSKAVGSGLPELPRPPGINERRQMGEKGIGRLAISSTGPQLLLVSRALQNLGTESDCLVVALVQWSLFEIPGLTLDDVVVPVRTVDDVVQIDQDLLRSLASEISEALELLGERVPRDYAIRVQRELAELDFDPGSFLRLNGPSPARGPGTAFIIRPVAEDLPAVMEIRDSNPDEYSVSEFQRFLLGFINTITPSENTPDFSTEFIRHSSVGYEDIIDPSTYFWEGDDFNLTDHTIEGDFDEFGQFSGRILLYGKTPIEVTEPWSGSKGDRSSCGPFRIKFGYVQGQASESSLSAEDFALMTRRLEKLGGLYVYRDGIRVLPYGNADNDYLEIEKRRSLNAGKYYFSYRRMFGAIEINSSANRLLQEKAGREGFRENRAYRDFRDILKGFLIQVAANFFSASGDSADEWRNERERLRRHALVRAGREKEEKKARDDFAKVLSDRLSYIESGRLGEDIERVLLESRHRIQADNAHNSPPIVATIEQHALDRLSSIRETVSLAKPSELALTSDQERDWRSYLGLKSFAENGILDASRTLQDLFNDTRSHAGRAEPNDRATLLRSQRILDAAEIRRAEVESLLTEIKKSTHRLSSQILHDAESQIQSFDSFLRQGTDFVGELDLVAQMRLEYEMQDKAARCSARLKELIRQIEHLLESESSVNELVVLKENILDLRAQIDNNLELLQLGQAVQIVSHEFDASIRSVRSGLQRLGPWAKTTPRLQPVVRDLRASFAHLDGYLRLFTPLQRRLYREVVDITGAEVEAFIMGVFIERLQRQDVLLEVSNDFRNWSFKGYPSTFYPVFVNLVDNAIYWVCSDGRKERKVILNADSQALYVRDTGPGVRPRDESAIFERGFGRRRGGRGLGLSLARELLERDGWALDLMPSESGAMFRISQRDAMGASR